jgi:hypothetical protein
MSKVVHLSTPVTSAVHTRAQRLCPSPRCPCSFSPPSPVSLLSGTQTLPSSCTTTFLLDQNVTMWNVVCKDPLEAERVGERRERKMRQANRDSVRSSSSVSSDTASGRKLDLAREDHRTSRSSNTTPSVSTPGTSPLHEIPGNKLLAIIQLAEADPYFPSEDKNMQALSGGPHNARPEGFFDTRSTSHWSDSSVSSVPYRSRHREERTQLAIERYVRLARRSTSGAEL